MHLQMASEIEFAVNSVALLQFLDVPCWPEALGILSRSM